MEIMQKVQLDQLKQRYERDGFVSGIEIVDTEEALRHRQIMESAEASFEKLHYKSKIHTILQSPLELATSSRVLDIVEALIGPDILLYNATYIVKEAATTNHVSWHQDLTYWGLSHDDQVTLWLALSPATLQSGCMRMIPGSHHGGRHEHEVTEDDSNVLLQGQTVRGVEETKAVACTLEPGEASFHHGWTLHASMPNISDDRRIGLNVQYIAPHVAQTKHSHDSAMLVRGQDRYRHFQPDIPAESDLDPAALLRIKALDDHYKTIAGS